ncbi:GNAT family N-acetyltransferase [Xylanimonas oleitrophica]|uniref:GNAT family N-acetyltransferase n=1 Tax=Xylanimonas oleitrophica TaxID=2607479 RepID=A0A2W5WLV7_9MICO|nr:N-acetyltransferase [Xylanimonas oleitrophica]PZR51982.1 GNAT family N-acetyltransferase [Xylanimonas oleitrophica]
MTGRIRLYTPADRDAVAEVCVRTGDAGEDARGLYPDDSLLPDVYALPYVDLEPATALVLVLSDDGTGAHDAVLRVPDGVLVGYVLGAPDTEQFVERWHHEWTPGFLERHPGAALVETGRRGGAGSGLLHDGVHPERMLPPVPAVLRSYPAHLHVDLLPQAQRQGWGRRLVDALCDVLAERDVPGVHLGYDPRNTGARAFYERLGFHELPGSRPEAPLLGRATGPTG